MYNKVMELLRVGHSPDPDDAFMYYALAKGKVTVEGYRLQQVLEDIQSLNQRALVGELEVTAISAAAYPQVFQHYRILACGASVGRNYGPIVVSTTPLVPAQLEGKRIGIPGELTTAYLLLRIYLQHSIVPVVMPFDAIVDAVCQGKVDAGVIIHEGQITWKQQGLFNVLDLGVEWNADTGLPIPLGLDMVHRRLGPEGGARVGQALKASVYYALTHEDDAIDYALDYGRGIDKETCRTFVGMYVNQDTLDMGVEGKRALETLYTRAQERGLIETVPPLDIVELD